MSSSTRQDSESLITYEDRILTLVKSDDTRYIPRAVLIDLEPRVCLVQVHAASKSEAILTGSPGHK